MHLLQQAILEPLEQRVLLTALYWDTSNSAGLQAGNGTWSTSAANWNTAPDGSGSRVAWTNGYDAVFTTSGTSAITISSSVNASSITVNGTGYSVSGGTLTLVGSATISANQNITINSVIAGSLGLNSSGTATLYLGGANTYSGGTNITAGVLTIGTGGTTGTLGSGDVVSNGTALRFNRSDTMVVSNNISGTGNINQQGSGTTVFTGTNTYSGTTHISNGVLQIGNGGTTGTLGTGITIDDSGVALRFNRSDTLIVSNNISGTGNINQFGTGTVILTGNNTFSGITNITNGTLQIGNGGTTGTLGTGQVNDNATLIFNRSDTYTVSNNIAGTGSLIQAGTGTVILNGNASYAGTTTIAAGTLQIGNGGTTGALGAGNVSGSGTLIINRSNSYTLANAFSGSGNLTQAGTGTTILTAANTYTGTTTIDAGTLKLSGSGTLGNAANLVLNDGTLDLNGTSQSVNALSGDAGNILNNADTTNSTLTVGTAGGGGTFAGAILDNDTAGTGTLALVKSGTGTLTLTGVADYSGTTTISAGTLQIGDTNVSGMLATGDILNNGTLTLAGPDDYILPNDISGTGDFIHAATGTTLLYGSNTATGDTTISAGTLHLTGSGTFGATGATLTVNSGATLTLDTTVAYSSATNNATIDLNTTDASILGILTNNGAINFLQPQSFITLTGDDIAHQGQTYTLNLGAVSTYITAIDTITDYIVHWGDRNSNSYTAGGDVTHTYGQSAASTNPGLLIDLVGENGTYNGVGNLTVAVYEYINFEDVTVGTEISNQYGSAVFSANDPVNHSMFTFAESPYYGGTASLICTNADGSIPAGDYNHMLNDFNVTFPNPVENLSFDVDYINETSPTQILQVDVYEQGTYAGTVDVQSNLSDPNNAPGTLTVDLSDYHMITEIRLHDMYDYHGLAFDNFAYQVVNVTSLTLADGAELTLNKTYVRSESTQPTFSVSINDLGQSILTVTGLLNADNAYTRAAAWVRLVGSDQSDVTQDLDASGVTFDLSSDPDVTYTLTSWVGSVAGPGPSGPAITIPVAAGPVKFTPSPALRVTAGAGAKPFTVEANQGTAKWAQDIDVYLCDETGQRLPVPGIDVKITSQIPGKTSFTVTVDRAVTKTVSGATYRIRFICDQDNADIQELIVE